MGFFDKSKKDKKKLPREIERIFQKLAEFEKPQKIVDKAISFRTLGEFDKAISILEEVLRKHPNYRPAKVVLGVTLAQKRDFVEAENYLKRILSEHATDKEFQSTEVYANLGQIRWKHYNDINGALKYYDLALKAPKIESMDGMILSNEAYHFMRSNVYADLCSLFFGEKKTDLAKKYAIKRLKVVRDCPIASRVLGTCLLGEYMDDDKILKYIVEDIEPRGLKEAARCFRTCLLENERDYFALYGISLSLFYLSSWATINGHDVDELVGKDPNRYIEKLTAYAQKSETAEELRKQFIGNVTRFTHLFKNLSEQ